MFTVAAVVAFAVILYLGRSLTFFGDEWSFILGRQLISLDSWMQPHNEHWSMFPVIVYRAVFTVVGLHSYLPYLAVLAAVHVAAAAGLFVLTRRLAGSFVALAGALIFLFLGSAWEDLFWAFQISFVGSVAAGVWALVFLAGPSQVKQLTRRSMIAAGLLLFVAIASSGLGVFFLIAAGALCMLDPARRSAVMAVGAVAAIYALWFLIYGRQGISSQHAPASLEALAGVKEFMLAGGTRGIGAMTSLGDSVGLILFVILVGGTGWRLLRGDRLPPLAGAAVAGLLAQLAITGLARDQINLSPSDAALASRYVYPSAAFVILGFSAYAGDRAKRLVGWWPALVLTPLVVVALVGNGRDLITGRDVFLNAATDLRAAVAWVETHPAAEFIKSTAWVTPGTPATPAEILSLVRSYGSPARDDLRPQDVPPIPPEVSDRALFGLVRSEFTFEETTREPVIVGAPIVESSSNVVVQPSGDCLSVRVIGPDPQIYLSAAGGSAYTFQTDVRGGVQAFLSRAAAPQEADSVVLETVTPATIYAITVPDLGDGVPWGLRLDPPDGMESGRVCAS